MVDLLLFLTGLIIGSFLGALTYRLPRSVNWVSGRSKCPSCGHEISWYDNIPLVSFVILGGKCRNCRQKISLRYPLLEFATAVTFVLVGPNVFGLVIACLLIAIFVIDIEHQLIPDELVYLGIIVLLAKFLIYDSNLIYQSLLAGFLSSFILLFLNIITFGKGMGLGDVKLAILLGFIVGLKLFLIFLFFAFVVGAIVGIIFVAFRMRSFKERIAFGPFLIVGCVLSLMFGQGFIKLLGF